MKKKKFSENINKETNPICENCHDIIKNNEIIYFCLCNKIYHISCLTNYLNRIYRDVHVPCVDCETNYKIMDFEIKDISVQENFQNKINNDCLNSYNIDTNLNNVDNYEELSDIAGRINHERMSELIDKRSNNNNSCISPCDTERIPLSPILLNHTPISGKYQRNYISSIQKNSEYFKLQSKNFVYF